MDKIKREMAAARFPAAGLLQELVCAMADMVEKKSDVLLIMGCPEVPVQNALALYLGYRFLKEGKSVLAAGNPSVIQLIRTSDPESRYIKDTLILDRAVEEIVDKGRTAATCVVFAHNDAGVSYAATMRHLLPLSRLVVILFGRDTEDLEKLVTFPCELVVEKAVHNPGMLKKKLHEVFHWAA